jgi:putative ABC transport system permease protein
MLDTLLQDIRHAARSLRRSPGFTAAAVLTLALGIGASSAVFSLADATAWRPPDVPRASQIVRILASDKDAPYAELSYPNYVELRSAARTMAGMVAYEHMTFSVARRATESARYVGGWAVSDNFFSALDIEPALGRGFTADDAHAARAVAVISHRLWTVLFDRDPAIVGRSTTISGAPFTIVGVAPPRFGSLELYFHPDLYIPLQAIRAAQPSMSPDVLEQRDSRWLTVIGRLRPGTSSPEAHAELSTLAQGIVRAHPADRPWTALVLPELTARARINEGDAQGSLVMLGLVGLLLLLACANVANLVIARSGARIREVALRTALGASTLRIVRQLLVEGLLLAAAGGVAGIAFARGVLAYLARVIIIPTALPLSVDLRVDARTLAVTATAAVVSGVLVGMAPAAIARRADLTAWMGRRVERTGFHRSPLRAALVVAQVAIAVLVLAAAGLLAKAFEAAQRVDPGFRPDGVLYATLDPSFVRYDAQATLRFYTRLAARVRELPGVTRVGLARDLPLGVSNSTLPFVIDGAARLPGQDRIEIGETRVDDGYWSAVGIPIVDGRAFSSSDTAQTTRVAIVNQTMARRYWPDASPIGRTIRIPAPPGSADGDVVLQIVGVARDSKYTSLAEPPTPFVYRPVAQARRLGVLSIVVLGARPDALAPLVRAAAAEIDPAVPIIEVRELAELYRLRALLPPRLMSELVSALGLIGVGLAGIGLYGVLAFVSMRRVREFGVRLAVGATPSSVAALVVRQGALLVAPGLAIGALLATLLTPLIGAPAFDFVSPRDPAVLIAATLVAASISLGAALLPALRAARIDPITTLRAE